MSSVQADGTNIPVYVLDKHGGYTFDCDHPQCDEWNQEGRRSFWRKHGMKENLVPLGWTAHMVQGGIFYKCPICYQKDLEAIGEEDQLQYIQIHHPHQVEPGFEEGGIPTQQMQNMNIGGGKRQKKRTRKRRKSRHKKRRKSQRKSRRKSRRKRGSGSNFSKDILREKKKIQAAFPNPTPGDLVVLICNIENDKINLTPDEAKQFRNQILNEGSSTNKVIDIISTWLVFQKGRINKDKKIFFQYNNFDDFMNIVRAEILEYK